MYFLIHYDRSLKKTVFIKQYRRLRAAECARYVLEKRMGDNWLDHRIFILDALSLDDLRRTHSHYFDTP